MSSGKDKIINDVCRYLKFYIENNNYPLFKNEFHISDEPVIYQDEEFAESIEKNDPENTENESDQLVAEKIKVTDNRKQEIPIFKEEWMNAETLQVFEQKIQTCDKCSNLSVSRTQVVFGHGNPEAKIVVVGEAPGADEDIQGKPFVGRAGKLLTDILKAINFDREEVYICNILKCRPPENRNPLPDEIAHCEPYLHKQLEMIKPMLILALGTFAAQTLLKSKEPLGRLRGKFHLYNGIKMMVTYHPAALLRNPNWKKPTWEDVQLFRKEFDTMINRK
ncbi:MAG: hypothetical protein HGGPFJEG_02513 [Ignavibacteria bacterium]|nr:hypothetical protein [Ignavibacteria bacterium]